jgi:hypothetical protein
MIYAMAMVAALALANCSTQRELSDDEWCRSFEYREGTREYAECRAQIMVALECLVGYTMKKSS